MRMRAFLAVFLFLAAGCADRSSSPPEVWGKGVYAAYNCQRCHRIGASGGDTGPDLTFVGFRKTAAALDVWLKDPSAWQPETLMPNFHLNDSARDDLAVYLATLKGQAFGEREAPWQAAAFAGKPVEQGKILFRRVGCASCHGKEGIGGYRNNNVPKGIIPHLRKVGELYSKEELIDKIRLGVRYPVKADPNGPEPYLYMPAWEEVLQDDEIAALADYLLFLSPPPSEEEEW